MVFDYAKLARTVLRVLRKFGAETTLTNPGSATYDDAAASTTATPSATTVQAAVFPYEDRYVDGTLILATDLQAFVATPGVAEPKPGHVLAWQGRNLSVIKTKNLGPAGVFVLYELQVRA